jgi:hypothetical protein
VVSFACAECGAEAARIEIERGVLRRTSLTSVLTQAAGRELGAAVRGGDAAAIYAVDPEVAAFWCPVCAASYCGDHWTRWNVFDEDDPSWHDSIRGACPRGHERLLED